MVPHYLWSYSYYSFIFLILPPQICQSSRSDLKTLQNKSLATSKLFLVTLIALLAIIVGPEGHKKKSPLNSFF